MKKCIFYLSILFILFCAVGCKNGTEQNINKDYLYTVTDATGNNWLCHNKWLIFDEK